MDESRKETRPERDAGRAEAINDLLASIHILSSSIDEVMEKQIRDEVGTELTVSQMKVLILVARTDAGSISNVAGFLGISNPAASKAVDRLVRRGLIHRIESAGDRRAMELSLTDEGRRILDNHYKAQNRLFASMFEGLDNPVFENTASFIDRLSAELIRSGIGPIDVCYRCGIYFRNKCLMRAQEDLGKCSCYPHPFRHGAEDAGLSGESREETR